MSDMMKQFLESGKTILQDSKTPGVKKASKKPEPLGAAKMSEEDKHKSFVKYTIQDKPKKQDVVEQLLKFIDKAEAEL